MNDPIKESFLRYSKLAKKRISGPVNLKEMGADGLGFDPFFGKSHSWFGTTIIQLEQSKDFYDLVLNFWNILGNGKLPEEFESGYKNPYLYNSSQYRKIWHFFRRSGFYWDLFYGKDIDEDSYFRLFVNNINCQTIHIKRLRLIERFGFGIDEINFDDFKIKKFTADELEALTKNQMNSSFYPSSVLDLKKLCQYWYIVEDIEKNKRVLEEKREKFELFDFDFRVMTDFPDRTIQLLTFFNWDRDWHPPDEPIKDDVGWFGFKIPFDIYITDELLKSPFPAPNLMQLNLRPDLNEIGEQIGESPDFITTLVERDLEELNEVVYNSKQFINNIELENCSWKFLDTAIKYLAKAFFTDGIEQLLWHIMVLEALLGESEQITDSIRRRLGTIYGKGKKQEIKKIRKEFNDLYELRSRIVHGDDIEEMELYHRHLRIAREFARKTVLWFINLLSFVHNELKANNLKPEEYIARKELLTILDFHSQSKHKIPSFQTDDISVKLPENFPSLEIWGEQKINFTGDMP